MICVINSGASAAGRASYDDASQQPLRFDLATGARLDEGRREKDALQPNRRREGGCVEGALLVHLVFSPVGRLTLPARRP